MVKVSIIIPVYNVEQQIARCIQSVINQTYQKLEIILVDDGSRDRSGIICDEYRLNDSRIKVIHKENGGVSSARNLGLECATGSYVVFLDGDDALDLDTISICVNELEDEKWDVVTFGYHMYEEKGDTISFQTDIRYRRSTAASNEEIYRNYIAYDDAGVFDFITDKIIRKKCITEANAKFQSRFNVGGEDAVFVLNLLPFVQNMKVTEHAFYQYYRRVGTSITSVFHQDKFDRYYERLQLLCKNMKEHNCFDADYVIKKYGTYFLWAYESMLLPSCKLKKLERWGFILRTFRKKPLFAGQNEAVKILFKDCVCFKEYCRSSRIAVYLFLKDRIFLLALWHLLSVGMWGKK